MHPRDTRRAGAAFLLGSVFFAYAFTLRVSPGIMVDDLMRDFRVGAALLGNLSAFYFYAYASLQIPVGVRIYEAADYRFALGVLPLAGLFGLALVFFLRET